MNRPIENGSGGSIGVSVIICTRNRCDKLAVTLGQLREIPASPAFEVIVVDNRSTDGTRAVVEAFLTSSPHPGRYVYCDGAGNGIGRNAGLALAQGEVIVFTDDDCRPEPGWIKAWTEVFSDPRIGFGGGRIMLHEPSALRMTINESTELVPSSMHQPVRAGLVQGANMAMRRSALRQAGLFDPAFGAGASFAGEDWELANRIGLAGWAGGYFPGPGVSHDHGRTAADKPRLQRFYGLGEGAVIAKSMFYGGPWHQVVPFWLRHIRREIKRRRYHHLRYVALGIGQYLVFRIANRDRTPRLADRQAVLTS